MENTQTHAAREVNSGYNTHGVAIATDYRTYGVMAFTVKMFFYEGLGRLRQTACQGVWLKNMGSKDIETVLASAPVPETECAEKLSLDSTMVHGYGGVTEGLQQHHYWASNFKFFYPAYMVGMQCTDVRAQN